MITRGVEEYRFARINGCTVLDRRRAEKNLLRWAEVTALCLELRKAALVHGGLTDAEAERQVWVEIRLSKELGWPTDKQLKGRIMASPGL